VSVPAANLERMRRMRERLEAAFAPASLDVVDDSHRHVGHAGAQGGQGHFTIDIVSDAFTGQTPLARHRAVYAALGEMMSDDIHALSIRAATPAERASRGAA
jgi:BolA family transcriptional regulator, general stress-responsive regulator